MQVFGYSAFQWIAPAVIALVFISLMSLIQEPNRRTWMAVIVGGAGSAYLSGGGYGKWELAFVIGMTLCAYKGLQSYRYIGVAWLLHTIWDILHHLNGHPLLPFDPLSSFGCAVCDPVIAAWCFAGAPSIGSSIRRTFVAMGRLALFLTPLLLPGQETTLSPSEFWLRYRDVPVTVERNLLKQVAARSSAVNIDQLRNPLSKRDRREIEKAIRSAAQGDHRAAIEQLGRLLIENPKTKPYVTSIRGVEYVELGQWDEAADDLRQAVRLMPQTPMNHYNYALALLRKGRFDQAELEAKLSLQLGQGSDAERILSIIQDRRANGLKVGLAPAPQ